MLVLVEVDDRVATVTLNRPEAGNAISGELTASSRTPSPTSTAASTWAVWCSPVPTPRSAPAWT